MPEEPAIPGVYISESFAANLGSFTTQQTVGNYPWVINYSTAEATSYDSNTQTNNPATSWLISTPVDFTNETEAYVAFEYIIRYSESGKVAANHQLLISNNYAGNAAEATWTDLPYNAVEGADWNTFYKANVAVPAEFLGKSGVVFALRYTATTKAGTWEVKNFKVAHGKAEVSVPEEAAEYTVAQALAAYTGGAKPAVVKGYIVGTINGISISDGAIFTGSVPAEAYVNLLIADNADETDYNNCMPVQLPSGAVRSALNLVDNPGNYKKLVTLTGSLEKYFGVAGLKNVTAYSIDEPETPANAYISEAFTNGFGVFATQETVGEYPWISDAMYGAMASGYADGAHQDAESWLISSAIDFTNETAAYIAFDYVINKGDASAAAANHKLLITNNYTGDVATTEWTEVNYGAVNNNSWAFHNTSNIALPESMMGKDAVVIAFKYMSTTANSSTWEIKNVVVASGIGTTPETPETPSEPETPAAASFDFTNPEALTPSVERATVEAGASLGVGVEFDEITFTNGNVTVKVSQGSASSPIKFWTRATGDVELRTYKSSIITISVSDGTMSSIVFKGGKVSTMSADCGLFSTGTWSGNANSVTFNVTGTLNIQKVAVLPTTAQTAKEMILKSADKETFGSISIPESIDVDGNRYTVTSIGNEAFFGCDSLTNIVIPNSVTSIGSYAFYGCSSVETLYISNTIETIGDYAFAECDRILEIKIGSKYAIMVSENIFSKNTYNNACLYVPAGRKFAYERTAPWNSFYIMEMDFTRIEDVKCENEAKGTIYDLRGRMVDNPINGVYIINGKKVLVK
ncbi:MAG: leucine-rich repeat domain-containing protein [Bacteroidaceae bacterium]|nr:leucine-rich repeat domain-containing protein [Bacteroidaceae bacterium]